MKPKLHKGRLIKWKDDRGFGFIKPDDGGKEVFLHISAIKHRERRPKVGDVIFYERVVESGGKVRAASASIQGVKPRSSQGVKPQSSSMKRPYSRKRQSRSPKLGIPNFAIAIIRVLIVLGTIGVIGRNFPSIMEALQTISTEPQATSTPKTVTQTPNCNIKGNISRNSGRKLYHVPGMPEYNETRIDRSRGERWFCSESEARQNGWTRAPR